MGGIGKLGNGPRMILARGADGKGAGERQPILARENRACGGICRRRPHLIHKFR
jgi:hypothetical protein